MFVGYNFLSIIIIIDFQLNINGIHIKFFHTLKWIFFITFKNMSFFTQTLFWITHNPGPYIFQSYTFRSHFVWIICHFNNIYAHRFLFFYLQFFFFLCKKDLVSLSYMVQENISWWKKIVKMICVTDCPYNM